MFAHPSTIWHIPGFRLTLPYKHLKRGGGLSTLNFSNIVNTEKFQNDPFGPFSTLWLVHPNSILIKIRKIKNQSKYSKNRFV